MPSYSGVGTYETEVTVDRAAMEFQKADKTKLWMKLRGKASNIDRQRCNLVNKAIGHGAEWILFVDSDMIVPTKITGELSEAPGGAIGQLLSHNKDIVSGLYFGKQPPYTPVMSRLDGNQFKDVMEYPDNELIRVDGCGGGFLLIRLSIFEKMSHPWFAFSPRGLEQDFNSLCEMSRSVAANKIRPKELISWINMLPQDRILDGEDYYFCRKAADAGFTVWVDTTVKLGHVGSYGFHEADFKGWEAANAVE